MSTSPTPAGQPFDPFAGMAAMNSTTASDAPPDDGYVPPVEDTTKASQTAETAKEDDEDDLVVGQQLDAVAAPSQASAPQDSGSQTSTASSGAAPASETGGSTDNNAGTDADQQQEEAHGSHGPNAGQIDPRMLAAAAAAEKAGQRQGGGGGGGGPGLSGLIAGAATGTVGLIGGGFKMLGNGVKALNRTDASLPKRKTVGEMIATRDPVKAETYYENAGDRVVAEKIYRDAFTGMNSAISEAKSAERLFQEGVGEMREVLENSDVKALADAAGTSIGDFIHSVKSGTVSDAAAKAVVQTLEQSSEFKAAEDKIVSAGSTFAEKKDAALAKMATIETSFPDRANTSMKKQQLSDLADGMKGDDVSKASAKVKKIMDEIESMANALKEAIRKALDKVASIFQPK